VNVDAGNADEFGMFERATESVRHFRGSDAELGGEQRGLQPDVRARADLRDEPQSDVGALPHAPRGGFDEFDFVNRINIDGKDSGAHRVVEFVVRFARAVEDDLCGAKSGAEGFEEFAAAIDFEVNSGLAHRREHSHVGVRFRGVAEFDGTIHRGGGLFEPGDVGAKARFGEDVERRAVRLNQFERVRAVDMETPVARFQKSSDRPRRGRGRLCWHVIKTPEIKWWQAGRVRR
jgi:hypothetical protein